MERTQKQGFINWSSHEGKDYKYSHTVIKKVIDEGNTTMCMKSVDLIFILGVTTGALVTIT